jgi:hypothetical protein
LLGAIAHATSVTTWQSLVQQQELSDEDAVALLVRMVLGAARAETPFQRSAGAAP